MIDNTDLDNESCRVCYAQAQVQYFGVMLCHSCKAFFKRSKSNANEASLNCFEDGYCTVRFYKHGMCPGCRLKKCLAVGLAPLFVACKTEKTFHEPVKFPTLSLLDQDGSSLTSDQWMLLNNLIYSFDINRPATLARRFIQEHPSGLFSRLRFKVPDYYNDLITQMYSVTHSFIHNNQDVAGLPSSQRELVYHHGYNNIAMFCGPVVARHLHLLENKRFTKTLDLTFGVKNRKCSQYIAGNSCTSMRAMPSIHGETLGETISLFRMQNAYTELTWKYLVYRYPLKDVIIRFDNLIRCFIIAQTSLAVMENDRQHEEILDSFINETNTIDDNV